ncbi:hypothetical protein [Bacteroides sp. GM023]|uniref:hypothetical protein n=1 Tax=Bacteroides sp. GM023 TaxID=2723058 RepID=UPI00168AA505|nr:hypothetical protein [Bacteroides sp. GM023]MBD3592558.1 hypothetical protein [Bacteroides sp. GM023]
MKTEKISDVLQGMDVNTEDAIVTLSDKIWELGNIGTIKEKVSDVVFTFHVVANVIGNYKGDGWQSIIEENRELLPYISQAMYEIGLPTVGEATKNIAYIFPLKMNVLSLDEKKFCEVVNFLRGISEGKYFTITIDELKGYTETEREHLTSLYLAEQEKINAVTEKMWNYDSPDNEGWGVVCRYLEKHLQDNFWK